MKERGMIFNGEMVRAILDGRKTQTRRIMKLQPKPSKSRPGDFWFSSKKLESMVHVSDLAPGNSPIADYHLFIQEHCCPFGAVGDRIWVRETWGVVSHELDEDGRIRPWTPDRPATVIHEMPFGNGYYSGHAIYAADGDFTWGDDDGYEDGRSCWKPSIHMPRAASRILLEITDVRVERLNAISEEDARAEGIIDGGCLNCGEPEPCGCANPEPDATDAFAYLWKSIYGQESWNADPWVWVIEFKRVE
ncbi:hypothetical protein ACV1EX_18330 [Klebsiella pneumoniae]|uniref:hypothetical protein n=1 Tax=Klebsiella pneumoniae TaxID=573 RepID=UPI000C1F0200|nr:hypothetical protein [Klebsiella pneumoniae]MBC4911843.1 hypothetical protein [Klebsiella pneumoniae]MBC4937210.1 hypothetical protein [Klebsiella pneumoniae]PXI76016.1 hypothetical protein DMQ65_09480 [Klebsiella pneumoniae]RLK78508.1 hypothetical protein D9K94_22070 [Klebsiella pneumoniae]RLK95947.1 hypothetical protein D9K83_13580 [Klebsiella pneumoniae]